MKLTHVIACLALAALSALAPNLMPGAGTSAFLMANAGAAPLALESPTALRCEGCSRTLGSGVNSGAAVRVEIKSSDGSQTYYRTIQTSAQPLTGDLIGGGGGEVDYGDGHYTTCPDLNVLRRHCAQGAQCSQRFRISVVMSEGTVPPALAGVEYEAGISDWGLNPQTDVSGDGQDWGGTTVLNGELRAKARCGDEAIARSYVQISINEDTLPGLPPGVEWDVEYQEVDPATGGPALDENGEPIPVPPPYMVVGLTCLDCVEASE